MTLDEFYLEDAGIFVRALRPLSVKLTQQAERLMGSTGSWTQRLPPWLIQLGKGGRRTDRETQQEVNYPEVSLYRHVMDVAFLASYLFYYAADTQHGFERLDDDGLLACTQALLVIAFFHDADKYVGAERSQSPQLDHVIQVWDDLQGVDWIDSRVWPDFSSAALHSAVSLVENRGQSHALLGPMLPRAIQNLAHIVGQADNFMSKLAVPDPYAGPRRWVEVYNQKIGIWHEIYGVPATPLHLIQLRDRPSVLQTIINAVRRSEAFYPLLVVRHGNLLALTLPDDIDTETFMTLIENYGFNSPKQPRVLRNRTNNAVTLVECENAEDLGAIVEYHAPSVQDVLTIKVSDLARIGDYLAFWAKASEGACRVVNDPSRRKLLAPLLVDADLIYPAYRRALVFALAVGDTAGLPAERHARLNRLLDGPGSIVPHSTSIRLALAELIDELDQVDVITWRTVAALQAALIITESKTTEFAAWVHGPFLTNHKSDDGGALLMRRIRAQVGLDASDSSDSPYGASTGTGSCLVCGTATDLEIKPSGMELVGIKRSAFNNRIGHQKSLWSQSEANYICPACLLAEGLAIKIVGKSDLRPRKSPLLVVTPSRALWHVPLESEQELLRSFDAVKMKDGRWRTVLPWQSDQHLNYPLGYEEKPDRDLADSGRNDDVLSQFWRMACYAAVSGEPVHVFTAAQRPISTALYYEPLPPWLAELICDISRDNGIGRKDLPELLDRLAIFRKIAGEPGGRDTLMDLGQYRWFAFAYHVSRNEPVDSKDLRAYLTHASPRIAKVKEWYPVPEQYSDMLKHAAQKIAQLQRLSWSDPRSKLLHTFRLVLDEYQAFPNLANADRDFRLAAISGLVYQSLERSEDGVRDYVVRDTVEACYAIIELVDREGQLTSKTAKHLLAAFEMELRQTIQERIAAHQAKQSQTVTP